MMLMTMFARRQNPLADRAFARQEPLDHPAIQRMSPRELADLPPTHR
ncbi:hypothetical protein [Roseibium aestuarii]|uniref:Uncharacterized protein n=1 Tax=Roseibium aestuarii TaxID=2600299 RepID=A0ABW4JXR8_9HYPH|nr:hypothetical protein [Roseibium aestuarii]